MDRSFGSSFLSSRSPFSPKTKLNESRRSTFRRSSRLSVSGKSTQSINQIVVRSANYYAETFGQPLPVMVTEALTFSEKNTVVSAHVSSNGYAWLVCGRRLLIWQYRQSVASVGTPQRRGALSNQCVELKLPQSDLAHRADLVSVFVAGGGGHAVSCVAASPEGVVRYWPSIAHEGVSVEECVDLQGQECDSLTEMDGLGCILATTTCTIVLVRPSVVAGRHVLTCKVLKTPSGWLGGFGKRVSSLIFGPISTEQHAETRLVRVLKVPIDDRSRYVYVLTGDSLQKWRLTANEPEQLLFVADLSTIISEAFLTAIWESRPGHQAKPDTWILDLQHDRENLILLVAGAQTTLSPQVHYALAYIDLDGVQPPMALRRFSPLKIADLYREEKPSEHLNYRFVVVGAQVYVYDARTIIVCGGGQTDPEGLEFHSPKDYLLCGCVCVNVPIFFSRNYGLVSVCGNDSEPCLNATAASLSNTLELGNDSVNNLTLYSIDPEEVASTFKATEDQLKAAFIFHIQLQHNACSNILDEIFPVSDTKGGSSSKLNKTVLNICKLLLDDQPTGDPRWAHGHEVGIGSSYSMQIVKQLEDKQKALSLYYKFLKDTGLWARLTYVVERDSNICTAYVLGEYAERIVIALTLKSQPINEILEKAMESSVQDIGMDDESGLTYQDLFYKDVSKIHRGLQHIATICESVANSAINPHEIGKTIVKANEIVLTVLEQVMQYRQINSNNFLPTEEARKTCPEYLPWTVANGSEGLLDALVLQQSLTYNYGIRNTSASSLHSTLYDQYVAFVDIILDGRKNHLESTVGTEKEHVLLKQYEKDRHNLIKPLIFDKQWERAALLAEKYLDFETLVVLCERTNNEQRLDDYIERFSVHGFPQYVYSWYLQENKQGKLISRCKRARDPKHSRQLVDFLSDHPSLSWIQSVMNGDYSRAADVLQNLAIQETDSLCRQKTMLSLAKLAKLASDDRGDDPSDNFVENTNNYLELVEFQEEIPDYVLQQFGYETVKPAVIPPIKMIHLYTCTEYKDATELDFKKALDLLPFVNQDVLDSCKVEIWRRAILRDSWHEKSLESPLEILQNKLFFKLAELTIELGNNLQAVLPPIDQLAEDPELRPLHANKTFQFLLKTAYEYFYQS